MVIAIFLYLKVERLQWNVKLFNTQNYGIRRSVTLSAHFRFTIKSNIQKFCGSFAPLHPLPHEKLPRTLPIKNGWS